MRRVSHYNIPRSFVSIPLRFTILIFENNIASTSKNYKMYKKTRPSYRKIGFHTREKHFMLNLYVPPSRALKIDSRVDSTKQIMLCS